MGSGNYFYPGGTLRGAFLNLSGGTVSGNTILNAFTVIGNSVFGSNVLATAFVDVNSSTNNQASLRIRSGSTVSSPNDGDVWKEVTGLKFYDGQTKTLIGSNVNRIGVNYTATTKDFGGFINVTGTTSITITLPNPTTVNIGVPLYVKDAGFSATTNNITIIPNSVSFTIDGLSSLTINQRAQIVGFYSDGLQYYTN